MRGVEAVIDMDRSAALLATALKADDLLLLTDIDAVYTDWAAAESRPIPTTTAAELRKKRFATDAMGPMVDAAWRFVEATSARAGMGSLEDAANNVARSAGTSIRR